MQWLCRRRPWSLCGGWLAVVLLLSGMAQAQSRSPDAVSSVKGSGQGSKVKQQSRNSPPRVSAEKSGGVLR